MRSTVVADECLESEDSITSWNGCLHDCELEPEQVQHAYFHPGDPPPFDHLEVPSSDVPTKKQIWG